MTSQQTLLYQCYCFLRAATDERDATDENDVMVMTHAVLVLLEKERKREIDPLIRTWFKYQVVFRLTSQQTLLYQRSSFLRAATDERAATNENDVMVITCVVLVMFERERQGERSINKHMV